MSASGDWGEFLKKEGRFQKILISIKTELHKGQVNCTWSQLYGVKMRLKHDEGGGIGKSFPTELKKVEKKNLANISFGTIVRTNKDLHN